MAIYAGETVKIFSTSLDWDNSPVTPVTGNASVTIYDNDGLVVLQSAQMEWVSERSRWEYHWLQENPGTYRIEVSVLSGVDVAKEVRTVKLVSARPVMQVTKYFQRVAD